ncbi:MAG: hypothetical protein NZT92_07690 [Abditibacteriales bacterium]|nr:hypothetical protein [Abditibacteriales bacterium]MDW8365146.1 hypothetical protein [Abditibacteriales bacterium]
MLNIINDKSVKQLALLMALLVSGLSLSHGAPLATCGARFALVYCAAMFMGRLACQIWEWANSPPSPHALETTDGATTHPEEGRSDGRSVEAHAPLAQGG